MDELVKNLWLLLTIAIPGMTTYGVFRLLILFNGAGKLDKAVLDKIDESSLITSCLIIALAIAQQAVSIVIEAALSQACSRCRNRDETYYKLFCERFKMAAEGKLSENATRIMGNFFLSLNVTIGQCMLLAYLLLYEKTKNQVAVLIVLLFIAVGLVTSLFRLRNAKSILSGTNQSDAARDSVRWVA